MMRLFAPAPSDRKPAAGDLRLALCEGTQAISTRRDEWDTLAAAMPSPFLTHAWLTSWAEAYGSRDVVTATLIGPGGRLDAGAMLLRVRGGFASPVHADSGDWDAVALTSAARRAFWEQFCGLRRPRLVLQRLRDDANGALTVRTALAGAGYGMLPFGDLQSPYVPLPGSFDELLAGRSSKLRANWRRSRRLLERSGRVRHRALTGGPALERDI
jgi:CelD/BcsL family acetyltransferase involved in cellulose biosynthesis